MRRRPILAALVSIGAGAAVASAALGGSVLRPPLRFQGNNWALVQWVDWKDVDPMCRELGAKTAPGRVIQACTREHYMIRPNPCPLSGYSADVDCHELGHVNGWPADHGVTLVAQ